MTEREETQSASGILRQSGWGKVSCLMVVAEVGLLVVGTPILYLVLMALAPPEARNYAEAYFYTAGASLVLVSIVIWVLSLVGVVFGVKGVLQKDRRKILAYLGLAVNGLILAGGVTLGPPALP